MNEQDLPYLDESITQLSSDLRADLATAFSNDLFKFAYGVLGFHDLTIGCHSPLASFLDHNPARFKHVEMPRDHLKTSLCTIARNMQRVVKNPNSRTLLINETSDNAERFLGAIRQHAESNRIFRALYSSVIPKNTKNHWNNTELRFQRDWVGPEPTIDSMGMTGAVTSRHYTHICIDDPISEAAVKSDLVMQDAINRISKVLTLMVDPGKDTFDLIGTRWAFADLYRHFMRLYKGKMALFIRGAVEEGVPIWPERFSLETLAQQRLDMGEYLFSCLMMNNPRNADVQDFNVDDIRFWEWTGPDRDKVALFAPDGGLVRVHELKELDISVSIDPAPAEKTSDDRNAVVTCGTTKWGDVLTLDVWAKRCSPLIVIEHLFNLRKRFHARVYGVEDVAYQKVFKHFLKAEANRRGEYFNVVPLKPGGKNKQHVRGLQPVAATGHLYLHPTQHLLRSELADYPLGEYDDTADALALNMQMWRGVVSPARWLKYKESEKQLLLRAREQARFAGIGDPSQAIVLPLQQGRKRNDPRYAIHEDDVEEPGWQGVAIR